MSCEGTRNVGCIVKKEEGKVTHRSDGRHTDKKIPQ